MQLQLLTLFLPPDSAMFKHIRMINQSLTTFFDKPLDGTRLGPRRSLVEEFRRCHLALVPAGGQRSPLQPFLRIEATIGLTATSPASKSLPIPPAVPRGEIDEPRMSRVAETSGKPSNQIQASVEGPGQQQAPCQAVQPAVPTLCISISAASASGSSTHSDGARRPGM